MDHAEATRLDAVERYLLGELDAHDSDAFEEHFFDCPECAEGVSSVSRVLTAARGPLEAEWPSPLVVPAPPAGAPALPFVPPAAPATAPAATRWRGRWAALGSLAAALVLAAYQGLVVIPRLQGEVEGLGALRAVPSRFLSVSRGEAPVVTVGTADRQLALTLSQSWDRPYASYHCELRDAADRPLVTGTLAPPSANDELEVLLPLRDLPSGSYTLVIEGREPGSTRPLGAPVARYPFTLARR